MKKTFYDKYNFSLPFRKWIWKRRLKEYLDEEDVLDLGCGCGQLTSLFRDAEGCDISEESLNIARKNNPNKRFFYYDIDGNEKLRKYNLIVSIGVLHHTKNGLKNLKKFKANKMVFAVFRKNGIYHKLYDVFKGVKMKGRNKISVAWNDAFNNPIMKFYDEADVMDHCNVLKIEDVLLTPVKIYEADGL